ncbi:MAG: PAS domain S-box protein [Anaerolineaceae bacterium]|nr:PAS domain S-box protein [Anaerolineaceae bacterium]
MKIKHQLLLFSLLFILLSISFSIKLIDLRLQYKKQVQHAKIAQDITSTAFDLFLVSESHLSTKEERLTNLWNTTYQELSGQIEAFEDESSLIDILRVDSAALENNFNNIRDNYRLEQTLIAEGAPPETIERTNAIEERLTTQMRLSVQKIMSTSYRLNIESRQKEQEIFTASTNLAAAYIVSLAILISMALLLRGRKIIQNLDLLMEGAEKIRSSQFGHLIKVENRDETGLLAQTLNQASVELNLLFEQERKYSGDLRQEIEAREKIEARLRDSEERFRATFEQAAVGIALFTPDHHFTRVNDHYCEMTGYTGDELLTMSLADMVHPDDFGNILTVEQQILNGKIDTGSIEMRHILKDRSSIWAKPSISLVRDSTGTPKYFIAVIEDINHRKQAEEKLIHSHDLMRYIIEHDRSAIAIHDKNLNYIYVSQRYLDEYEVKDRNIIGKHHYEVFPDLPEKWRLVHQKALAGEVTSAEDDLYIRGDGRVDYTRWECRPWYESDGSIGGIIIYTEITTQRKKIEIEKTELNNQLQILIAAIQEISNASNLDQIMATVRGYSRKLVGSDGSTFVLLEGDSCYYADEESISPLWKGQRFPVSECISGWVMKNHKPAVIEDIYQDSRIPIDSYRKTFVKSLVMVPIRANDPIGAIGNYWREQTQPTEMDLQLMQTLADAAASAMENVRLLEDLEQRVAERTHELEISNRELESFAYSVSHDLRAPLRAIDGFSRILQEEYADRLDQEGKRLFDIIRNNTSKMDHLITDLLSLSRVSRSALNYTMIDMESMVRSILDENIHPEILQSFSIHLTDLPNVPGDSTLIQQVWVNLISNAIKYTLPKDVREISITGFENDRVCTYTIRDNGVGFDMNYTDKLFELFSRLHKQSDFDGTGVGLAIVQRIVHRHGGQVWAEGEEGKGAAFSFTIPK